VPLALLAALYTSEFMNPRHKGLVRSSLRIEMMASLPERRARLPRPLILAPAIEDVVLAVLLAAVLMPVPRASAVSSGARSRSRAARAANACGSRA
jgi:phosphate transport system permease protein